MIPYRAHLVCTCCGASNALPTLTPPEAWAAQDGEIRAEVCRRTELATAQLRTQLAAAEAEIERLGRGIVRLQEDLRASVEREKATRDAALASMRPWWVTR